MSNQDVKFEGSLDVKQVVSYLEDLIKGLKDGKVCVQENNRFVTLSPTEVIHLEIEAERKKTSESLSIELSWTQKLIQSEGKVPLKISTTEPLVSKEAHVKEGKEEKPSKEDEKHKEDKDEKKKDKKDKEDKEDKEDKKDKKEKKDKEHKKDEKKSKDKNDKKKNETEKMQHEFKFRKPVRTKKMVL